MTTACITVRLDEHKLAAAINPNRNEVWKLARPTARPTPTGPTP